MDWNPISSEKQIEEIIQLSFHHPIAIFKHSTSCSISYMAKMRLEENISIVNQNVSFYFLDLLKYRSISNLISETFEVYHESPQLILIKDGEAEYDASHFDISVDELNETLAFHYG
jgi:bacillithiol system protein YtxJ